jgi:hypothetical protein
MAHDAGGGKVPAFFRCSFENCAMHFSAADGYFESGRPAGDRDLLNRLEILTCKLNHDHHPCITGYAMESIGGATEEWRQWQCFTKECDFSLRQKLSPASNKPKLSGLVNARAQRPQHEYLFANR